MEKIELNLTEDSPYGRAGEKVMLSLTPADVHEPAELPTFLQGYRSPGFRADEASKVILVDHNQDKYRTFSSNDAFRLVVVKGSSDGATPEVDPQSSVATYTVTERFVGSFVSDVTLQNASGPMRPKQAAMKRCKNAIQLDQEVNVWTMLTTSGNWNSNNRVTLSSGQQWNGGASSDPLANLQDRVVASAQEVNAIWMNQQVAFTFLRHASVRDHMRQLLGDSAANGTTAMVAMANAQNVDFIIPGLPPIHVTASKYLNETTNTLDYVLNDSVVLLTTPPGVPVDGEDIATTYTFRRKGVGATGFSVREFRVENRGPLGGTMLVCSVADVPVMTGNNCGGVIFDVIQ